MASSVAMLDELEGAGIDDRREQARALGVSMPQIDRIRQALRETDRDRELRARRGRAKSPSTRDARRGPDGRARRNSGSAGRAAADAAEMIQLGVRVPAAIIDRLKRHSVRAGVSVALLTAVALDEWLKSHGSPGPSGISRKERAALHA